MQEEKKETIKSEEVKTQPTNITQPVPEQKAIPVNDMPIVSPSLWRKKNYNIRKLQLPSGIVVKVKDVDLANMAMSGALSIPLLNIFFDLQSKLPKMDSEKAETEKALKDFSGEDLMAMNEMVDKFVLKAVIEPKLVEKDTGAVEDEDAIPVNEMEFVDKMFIFQSCTRGGAASFAGFSEK